MTTSPNEAGPSATAASPVPLSAKPARPRLGSPIRWLVRFGLFWSWNLVFLLVVGFAIAPYVVWEMLLEVADGLLPPSLLVSALFILVIPAVASLVAAWPLRRHSERWLPLMYGLEAPLFLVGLFRLFALREVPPAAGWVLVFIGLGILSFGYSFALGTESKSRAAAVLRSLGAGFSLSTAAYLGALLSFYAIPTAIWLVLGFLRFEWLRELGNLIRQTHGTALIWAPMAMFLFFYAASLFAVLPFALIALYARQGWTIVRAAARILPRWQVAVLVLLVPISGELGYEVLGKQTQRQVFALLDPGHEGSAVSPQRSDADRQLLLSRKDEIRQGLLNAYLAPYRYLSATGSNNHIRDWCRHGGRLSDGRADSLQQLYNLLVAPFLYQGSSLAADQSRAESLYESFFDAPIQKAERETILAALSATYDRDQRQAGLLNIGQRKVHLQKQELRVQEHPGFASIELHEVYENQTVEQQEIFYYFSLPESAVITGLWLGDTDDRARRFVGNVAPRGAAQRVYNREVQRRADPALLEQVGPRQYRLRAFPIPPRARLSRSRFVPDRDNLPPPILHLWLTYDVLAENGSWPLPSLREQRNVYADRSTVRLLNGQTSSFPRIDSRAWLPAHIPAQSAAPLTAQQSTFSVGTADSGSLEVQVAKVSKGESVLAPQQTFALVIDRTLSMGRHAAALSENIDWIKKNIAPQHRVHVYMTAAASRGEAPTRIDDIAGFDPRTVQFFGGHRLGALLRQFATLRGRQEYRAVLVLTDDGSMDFADDKDAIADFHAPVFFVHLGGSLAAGYDDASLATMQKRGGTATQTVGEAFARIAAAGAGTTEPLLLSEVIDGHRFTVRRLPATAPKIAAPAPSTTPMPGQPATVASPPSPPVPPSPPPVLQADDPFHALAARALILALLREVDHGEAGALDRLHAVAKAHSQVSPYSSLIVLVNDDQRRALEQAEKEKDRFQRQVESGKEALTAPHDMMVSGVPEPEEWLLILVVGIAVLFAVRRN